MLTCKRNVSIAHQTSPKLLKNNIFYDSPPYKSHPADLERHLQGRRQQDMENARILLSASMQAGKGTIFDQILFSISIGEISLSPASTDHRSQYVQDLINLYEAQMRFNSECITGSPSKIPSKRQDMQRALCALVCRDNAVEILQSNIVRIKTLWSNDPKME